jgi:hypothetical protein
MKGGSLRKAIPAAKPYDGENPIPNMFMMAKPVPRG